MMKRTILLTTFLLLSVFMIGQNTSISYDNIRTDNIRSYRTNLTKMWNDVLCGKNLTVTDTIKGNILSPRTGTTQVFTGLVKVIDTLKVDIIYPNSATNDLLIDGYVTFPDTIKTTYIEYSTLIFLNSGQKLVYTSATMRPAITGGFDLGSSSFCYGNGYINSLTSDGTSARTWGVARNTTSNTAGSNLTLYSGSATTGATDKNGGMLLLVPGVSTGTGVSSFRIQRNARAASTATSNNALTDAFIIPSSKICQDNTSTTLFNVAVSAGTSYGVTVEYTIKTIGGAGNESHTETGTLYLQGSNDGAVTTTPTKVSAAQHKSNAGTYTVTFAASAANPSVISVTADSDLNVTSVISYVIVNSDGQVITQL